jgi:4-alpha-glucanotransferase
MAALYDGFRIDHLIGLYRTYGKPPDGEPFFTPGDEPSQLAQGERVLRAFQESGATVLAEDLGVIPDFVRASMARLGVPGSKVLRWERHWHDPGQPFVDPAEFPPASMAITGTHDTETLVEWWERAPADERQRVLELPLLRHLATDDPTGAVEWTPGLRDALLESAFAAGSNDTFATLQDVFGWRDRINTPATISPANWTWRTPWPLDVWSTRPEPAERAEWCRRMARRAHRLADAKRAGSID